VKDWGKSPGNPSGESSGAAITFIQAFLSVIWVEVIKWIKRRKGNKLLNSY
jgi:hypothetical protein